MGNENENWYIIVVPAILDVIVDKQLIISKILLCGCKNQACLALPQCVLANYNAKWCGEMRGAVDNGKKLIRKLETLMRCYTIGVSIIWQ